MTSGEVLDIASRGLIVCAKVAGPFLAVVLALGVIIGLFQSITQLQEPTLSFVPKLVGAGLVIVVGGTWMLDQLLSFAHEVITAAPDLIKG